MKPANGSELPIPVWQTTNRPDRVSSIVSVKKKKLAGPEQRCGERVKQLEKKQRNRLAVVVGGERRNSSRLVESILPFNSVSCPSLFVGFLSSRESPGWWYSTPGSGWTLVLSLLSRKEKRSPVFVGLRLDFKVLWDDVARHPNVLIPSY